jgi:hypothetical protein
VGDTGSIGRDGRDDMRTDDMRLNGRAGGRGLGRTHRVSGAPRGEGTPHSGWTIGST